MDWNQTLIAACFLLVAVEQLLVRWQIRRLWQEVDYLQWLAGTRDKEGEREG